MRHPFLALAALAALLAAAPAQAQVQAHAPRPRHPPAAHPSAPPAPRVTEPPPAPAAAPVAPPVPLTPAEAAAARCRALLGNAPVTRGPDGIEALDDGGCRFKGVRFGLAAFFGYEVAELVEHGVPSGMPDRPVSVQVDAHGVTLAISGANAKAAFISQQQQVPFDVAFDGGFDPGTHELTVRRLALDGAALGHTSLATALTGMNPETFPDEAALRSLHVHMDSRRFLPAFALAPAVTALPDDGNPAAAFERAKAQVGAQARLFVSMTGAAPDTVEAVAAFIADFPHPQHVLDLDLTASPPLPALAVGGMVDAPSPDPAAIAALLRTLTVTATYTGDPQ